jgi:hypothetical protein
MLIFDPAPTCPECAWDLEDDGDELSCSNPYECNAQVDVEERAQWSTPPAGERQPVKLGRRRAPITEAYVVDLIRRGRYKQFLRRRRNERR